MTKVALSRLDRGIAAGLAVIFIVAGIIGVVIGLASSRWVMDLVGLISIWWGCIWMGVACKGRRLQSCELLWPFPWR
jgi:hypothetical protein